MEGFTNHLIGRNYIRIALLWQLHELHHQKSTRKGIRCLK
jgi:sterol desaturase/sphingolipid hydroxylase (fatty acid hydroxylase superfamily)